MSGRASVSNRWQEDYPATFGSSLLAWWDASKSLTVDGSNNVSIWPDQKAGYNLLQATAGNRPAFNATGFNGGRCVDWGAGAANRELIVDSFPLALFTLVGVVQADASSGYLYVHNTDAGTDGSYIYGLGTASAGVYRSSVVSGKNVSPSAAWLSDGVRRSVAQVFGGTHASHLLYRSGVQESTTNSGGSSDPGAGTVTGTLHVGQFNATGIYKGKIAELMFFNRLLSPTEIASFEPYFRGKWRI